jgi:chromosome segregation protein
VYLKSLRMRGFKSFPQSVELRFEDAIAVIVGPNGSGKSNIADALQWAMATQAPAQLRAANSQDVLFGGSDGRPPAGVCEVELVLDNSCGTLDLEFDEVSIMRRLYRDGESEYLLNRARVRRLDVLELLSDTGLGREMHSIIGQGRVEEILLSKPHERRRFVEEAAGLGKYQRRRTRAEAKLARVAGELERARDLEREVRARLRPLQMQATAADRAAKLVGEIASARIALLSSELVGERRRLHDTDTRLERAVELRSAADAVLAQLAERRSAAEQELAGLAAQQERAAHAFYAFDTARSRAAEQLERLQRAGETLVRAGERRAAAASRLEAEAARFEAEAKAANRDAATAREQHARLAAADDGGAAEVATATESALAEALNARRALAEVEGEAEYLRANRAQAEQRVAELDALLAALAADATASAAALAGARERLVAAEAAATFAGSELERLQAAADGATAAREQAERGARDAASEAARAVHEVELLGVRVDGLARLLERGEGLAPAARELRSNGLDLVLAGVEPAAGYERAVAAALGWRAGAVIAARLADAVDLVQQAEGELAVVVAGRGGEATGRPPAPGARRLTELAQVRDPAVAHLLEDVWVVEDLAAVRHGLAVTRDGIGLDADRGELWRVADSGEAGWLAARSEHQRLTGELAELRTRAERAEGRAAAAAAEAATSAAAATVAVEQLEQAELAAREAVAALRTAASEHDGLADRLARADAARDVAQRDIEVERARLAGLDAEAQAAAGRRAAGAEAAAAADRRHGELDKRRRELAERVARRSAELAGLDERARRHEDDAARLRRQAAAAVASAQAAHERHQAAAGQAPRVAAAVASLTALVAAAESLRGPARAGIEAIELRAGSLAEELRACAQDEASAQAEARAAAQAATELEVGRARAEQRIGELGRRRDELAAGSDVQVEEPEQPLEPDEAAGLAARVERLERRRESLGAVNPLAAEEYEAERIRVDDLATQCADLERSLAELRTLIADLTQTIDRRFAETFGQVAGNFAEVVQTLFPGGHGRLVLTDDVVSAKEPDRADAGGDEAEVAEPAPAADPGIELEVRPAGKRTMPLSLLSGGEKSLTAIAFLFALLLTRPSPFYVLDEVEAALDDANIERFLGLLRAFQGRAQFIVITHQRRTMEVADILYGVSMAADGESRVLSRRMPEEQTATAS